MITSKKNGTSFGLVALMRANHRRFVMPLDRIYQRLYCKQNNPILQLTIAPFAPTPIILSATESITIRLLESTDAPKLLAYFNNLSDQTKSYFGPHSFDKETVNTICATLNPTECVRLVAVSSDDQLIAYTLLQSGATPSDTGRYNALGININPETDCSLAPSIADAYQSRGLGNHLMTRALTLARTLGKKRVILWGGVQTRNERAVRYYRKYGFMELAPFEHNDVANYDMYVSIE